MFDYQQLNIINFHKLFMEKTFYLFVDLIFACTSEAVFAQKIHCVCVSWLLISNEATGIQQTKCQTHF